MNAPISQGVEALYFLTILFTILSRAQRMRVHFCQQHWLLRHLGFVSVRVRVRVRPNPKVIFIWPGVFGWGQFFLPLKNIKMILPTTIELRINII